MSYSIIFLFLSLIVLSLYILSQKSYINVIIGYGVFSVAISVLFFLLNAPDVAFVEITIGAAFVVFIYLIAIKKTAEVKVYYIETPYMIEEKEGNLYGFEYELIKEFLERKGLDADFIKVDAEDPMDNINDHGEILAGGIILENNYDNIIPSDGILLSKLYAVGQPNKICLGIFMPNLKSKSFEDLDDDFIIDAVRLRKIVMGEERLLSKKIEIIKDTSYRIIFYKRDKSLARDFNKFLEEIKSDTEYYENLVRRYIG
ncbi:hydrogenase subunit MbhD domain-containing protein [Petrotoga olearia]|uniref:Multicomponent Na+:H+ antiporter subunit B n=1 Tax=Petrotoga olearia TaxID=156203 RepID=A0ABX9UF56_9BACT|nr:hydrogenase subunit MbhD domain-containing protein [Petrotoga olearia]RMA76406.1 putative multicomponent Na+:H+ antiporter subunit B [Petrotoga olearia]